LLSSLYECCTEDQALYQTLFRLKEKATHDFATIPALRLLTPENRRLALAFTGYLYIREPPLIGSLIISNFLDAANNRLHQRAQDEFLLLHERERTPFQATFIVPLGAHGVVRSEDVEALRSMLVHKKPADALIGKATRLMLEFSDRAASGGTIGKQISWIRMMPDPSIGLQSGYYSNVPTTVGYLPNVIVLKDGEKACFDMGHYTVDGPDGPEIVAGQPVGRNAPCPCKSGLKYKRCHGGRRRAP
jgi:hypothetical protein